MLWESQGGRNMILLNNSGLWITMTIMRLWISRLLIGIVTAWNLQAALVFMLSPALFIRSFELSGTGGETALRGMGVLFLMWNVPYIAALLHPLRHRLALVLAASMQFIGLAGESYILSTLPIQHTALRSSIMRFIGFDGAGLVLLAAAAWISRKANLSNQT